MSAVADYYRFRLDTMSTESCVAPDENVVFVDAIQTLAKKTLRLDSHVFFVEISPHPGLASPVRQSLSDPDLPKVSFDSHPVLQRKLDSITSALTLTGSLFERGINVEWNAVSAMAHGADQAAVLYELPAYSWDHFIQHSQEFRLTQVYRLRNEPYHELLGVPVLDATDSQPRWRHSISRTSLPWLADHAIDCVTMFPSAGYISMAIEALMQVSRRCCPVSSLGTLVLHDVEFKRKLFMPDDAQRVGLQLSLQQHPGADLAFGFSITALSDSTGHWHTHATGVIEADSSIHKGTGFPPMPDTSHTIPYESLYRDLDSVGNTYGPTFAGISSIKVAPDGSQSSSSLIVPDAVAMVSDGHQTPLIIHPSTLEGMFQTVFPLQSLRFGPGLIMPSHISELLVATSSLLQAPGSSFEISTLLDPIESDPASWSISSACDDNQVISISGLKLQSLTKPPTNIKRDEDGDIPANICYELRLQPDLDHLRTDHMPPNPSFADIVGLLASKQDQLSMIGLGAGVDLSEDFTAAFKSPNNKITTFDFIDTTPGLFDEAATRLDNSLVQFRTMIPTSDPKMRGLQLGYYDLALATSTKWLSQAEMLVKPNGFVLLRLNQRESKEYTSQNTTSTSLTEQIVYIDDARDRLVVLTRSTRVHNMPVTHVLTHCVPQDAPAWSVALVRALQAAKENVTINRLTQSVVEDIQRTGALGDTCNDAQTRSRQDAITTLLANSSRLVWRSPDAPPSFHRNESLARTAHTVNDKLRLTTVNASSLFLASDLNQARLVEIVAGTINQVSNLGMPQTEREYRVQELASCERPLVLSPDGAGLFLLDDRETLATPIDPDSIEVEAQNLAMGDPSSRPKMGAYTGYVTNVGSELISLAPGDHVIALAPVVGATRLRIPGTLAGRLPVKLPSLDAAAMLLEAMTASYAIREVNGMISGRGTILIHGAGTAVGRAAIGIARSIGIRLVATAANSTEARLLKEHLGIDPSDVLVTRASFHRRLPRDIFPDGLDAVIHAAGNSTPAEEVLVHIKPFGSVVVIGHSSLSISSKLPPNVALHFVDIDSLVQARPNLTTTLVSQATAAFQHIPMGGFNLAVGDVFEVADALKMLKNGIVSKVVLQASSESTVPVLPSSENDPWSNQNAAYIISGKLGSLEQNLMMQMVRRGARHVVLVSRGPVDPNDTKTLQAKLQAIRPGAWLYIAQGDISSESALREISSTLASRGVPTVHGIFRPPLPEL
ncbi:hypothetical protein PENCOP_c002G00822 [Penicillium coprophilum]|uniref:PKS/mFAS DH domain-containing protein n=1 Tax=Penicillium coprophilum TaxID=36646 RepID=A0A1V6V2E1_9EURO|nr:hypothetical protein PENCOP_c002G00822 [Penicillium coprophilum]